MDPEGSGAGFSVFRKEMAGMPDQEKTAEGTPGSGNTAEDKAAPASVPQWIKDILADEGKGKEFLRFTTSTYQEQFAKHKQESERRENTWKGHATSSDYWKKLDDAGREHVSDASANLEDAVATAVERGVPAELLEDHTTAAGVRGFAAKYLKANSTKPSVGPQGTDAIEALVAAKVAELLGKQSATEKRASEPNPWGLDLSGGKRSAPALAYKDILKSGKPMPSAAEIDGAVAQSFRR